MTNRFATLRLQAKQKLGIGIHLFEFYFSSACSKVYGNECQAPLTASSEWISQLWSRKRVHEVIYKVNTSKTPLQVRKLNSLWLIESKTRSINVPCDNAISFFHFTCTEQDQLQKKNHPPDNKPLCYKEVVFVAHWRKVVDLLLRNKTAKQSWPFLCLVRCDLLFLSTTRRLLYWSQLPECGMQKHNYMTNIIIRSNKLRKHQQKFQKKMQYLPK